MDTTYDTALEKLRRIRVRAYQELMTLEKKSIDVPSVEADRIAAEQSGFVRGIDRCYQALCGEQLANPLPGLEKAR